MNTRFSVKLSLKLFLAVLFAAAVFCLPSAVFAEEDSDPVQIDNGIPVVYLNIDESKGSIQDMIESPDHSVYCYGSVTIDVPEGFHYSDFPDLPCEGVTDLSMSIRGRGNSSWQHSAIKKPFKIKLDKKADLFGLGANKHWALIANASDSTLLKDRITGWLGDEMGFAFTPRGVPVDLVITGQQFGSKYYGSYYLTENVRVGDNRLDIEELDNSDTDPHTITGGYLIQNGIQVRDGSPDRFFTKRGAEWATDTPSFDTGENTLGSGLDEGEETFTGNELGDGYVNHVQQDYIQNYVQMFEDVLFEQGTAYRDLMDVESAAKYWLVQEFSLNGDAFATGSTYFYKDRDPENGVSKIYWGPLWDFDYAWNYQPYTTGFPYGHDWNKPMLYDREEGGFVQELYKQWPEMKVALEKMIAKDGLIDQYYKETKASAEKNHELYFPNDKDFDYKKEVEGLKSWIRNRIDWVDEHFDELKNLIHRIQYVVDGEVYATDFQEDGGYVYGTWKHPDKEGYFFLGWTDEDGNIIEDPVKVTKDLTITAKYVPDSEVTRGEDISFSKDNDIVVYDAHIDTYMISYRVIPTDAQDQSVTWTSSDESYATVDREGFITYQGEGTVTVTATLKNGKSRDFTLTVTKGKAPIPESIRPKSDVIRMKVGEQTPLMIETSPSPAKIVDYVYESENTDVVTAGECGVLTAVGPGTAKVKVRTESLKENGDSVFRETEATVEVSESPSCPQDETCPIHAFKDMDPTAWYHDGVHFALEKKIMNGTAADRFEPNTSVTRAMTVTMLWRLAGSPALADGESQETLRFDDVEKDSWYEQAVNWAVAQGIVNGYGNGKFGPTDKITREQFAVILYRYEMNNERPSQSASQTAQPQHAIDIEIKDFGSLSVPSGESQGNHSFALDTYTDADQISDWALDAMTWAVEKGLITGMTETTLAPAGLTTRAQAATLLMRISKS